MIYLWCDAEMWQSRLYVQEIYALEFIILTFLLLWKNDKGC